MRAVLSGLSRTPMPQSTCCVAKSDWRVNSSWLIWNVIKAVVRGTRLLYGAYRFFQEAEVLFVSHVMLILRCVGYLLEPTRHCYASLLT